jgi:carboxypeptidase C (cathepsin A)
MEVAGALARRRTPVAGVVLISGDYDVGQKVAPALDTALDVPLFTATAWYHKRLPPDLQALPREEVVERSTEWAKGTYAPALQRKDSLSEAERAALLAELTRFTAIDAKFVDAKILTVRKDQFMDRLLEDRGEELGRYDSRMVVKQRDPSLGPWLPTVDPSLAPMIGIMQGASVPIIRYIRDTLGYRSDLMYRGPFGEAFHPKPLVASPRGLPDDWMAAMWENGLKPPEPNAKPPGKPLGASDLPPLRQAMERQPKLQVFNVRGLYDLSCAAIDEAVAQSPAGIGERVRNRCYPAGHMLYTDAPLRAALAKDFDDFVKDASAR